MAWGDRVQGTSFGIKLSKKATHQWTGIIEAQIRPFFVQLGFLDNNFGTKEKLIVIIETRP